MIQSQSHSHPIEPSEPFPATQTSISASTAQTQTHPLLTSTAPVYLPHCPSAIILQLANDFLHDRDVARWAATERRMLSILQTYSIRRAVSFHEAWTWRWDSLKALMEAVKNPNPNSDSESLSSTSSTNTDSNTAAAAACTSSRSPFRIGRLRATIVDDDQTIQEIISSGEMSDGDGEGESESAFMQRLMSAYLPTTVECIIFQLPLNKRFLSCTLPHHITQLCIERFDPILPHSELSALLAGWILPSSLHSLRLCGVAAIDAYTFPLNQLTLPHALTKLHLGFWDGDSDQLPMLPPNLQSLHMGYYFNAPIDSIAWPPTLTSLTLGDEFKRSLGCVRLPDSLTSLNLGRAYNHPIERMHIPASLTHLQFGYGFRQPLRDWTPPASLSHLILPGLWNHGPSQLRLPANLLTLALPCEFNSRREPLSQLHLPPGLHTLRLGGRMRGNDLTALTLPHALTSLNLGNGCHASLDDVRWPPHLTRLVIGKGFNQPLVHWSPPSSLRELTLHGGEEFDDGWNQPVTKLRLPANLVKLSFGHAFDRSLTGLQFPPSLRVLEFGFSFDQSLARDAWTPPRNLEELHLTGHCWDRPCAELYLPPRLRKLTLSFPFNQPVENERGECILHLPDTLVELRLGRRFNQSLRSLHLPASLRLLSIPCPGASYTVDQLPASLPRLQCLEVWNESAFHAQGWAQHPQWPRLIQQCAISCVAESDREWQDWSRELQREWGDVTVTRDE